MKDIYRKRITAGSGSPFLIDIRTYMEMGNNR